jgi:putative OmpL-like beta-barrel porin-2
MAVSFLVLFAHSVAAQQASATMAKQETVRDASNALRPHAAMHSSSENREGDRLLLDRIERLEQRSAKMESHGGIDGYYSYNFNHPGSHENLMDAYIASHNSFRLNHETAFQDVEDRQSKPRWNYGGFLDLGYLLDFNHPANKVFRSRGTASHVDGVHLNMAGAYVRKKPSEESRWGAELTFHAGKDSEVFGFSATAPNFPGFEWMRHLGPTNVSYLAPVGKGLTVQGGIFGSLIGYDSLYAKDNFTYSRPWGADFTPYFMMGVNASYPFNEKLTAGFFLINGYWHLANANRVPSSGGQLAYKPSPRLTLKETVLWGPHQSNTSFKFWRSLSDSLVECRGDRVTFAFEYLTSWERVEGTGARRALMMAGQLPVHWTLNNRWSATVRPEVFWDRDGRWTLARQTVKAVTTTLEYRIPYKWTNTILRLEHRYDDSRGPDGGFFRGAEVHPGVVGLTPTQHLLIFGLIFTFDR